MARDKSKVEEPEAEGFDPGFTARYRVAPEQAPGVYRQGVGFFRPGQVLSWPDPATPVKPIDGSEFPELLSAKLVPLDEGSRTLLVAMHENRPGVIELLKKKRKEQATGDAGIKAVETSKPKKKRVRALTAKQVAAGESEVEEVEDNAGAADAAGGRAADR